MSKILTEKQFQDLTEDLPEDGFTTIVPLIMESFTSKRGRTLDTTQVASLCVGLMEMSATIDAQITLIGQLQGELQECQKKTQQTSRLWKPE